MRIPVAGAVMVLTACAGVNPNADYDRHYYSRLQDTQSEGSLLFEARSSAAYPLDSEIAEQTRMQWLAQWMQIRQLCPSGYDVLGREQSSSPADRYGYDLRYRLRCR